MNLNDKGYKGAVTTYEKTSVLTKALGQGFDRLLPTYKYA